MFKERLRFLRSLLFAFDAVLISISFFFMFFLRQYLPKVYSLDLLPGVYVLEKTVLSLNDYIAAYFLLLGMWLMVLRLNRMYPPMRVKATANIAWNMVKSAFIVVMIFGTLAFLFKLKFMSRFVFGGFIAVSAFLLFLERYIFLLIERHVMRREFQLVRLLIVGTGDRSTRLRDQISEHPEWGYQIVKVVDLEECLICRGTEIEGCEVLRTEEDMRKILHEETIDQVIFEVPKSELDSVENFIYVCEEEGVDSAIGVDFFGLALPDIHHTDIGGIPLVVFERSFGKEWQLFVKRTMDVVISAFGIVFLSPLLLIVVILIKITSPGKIFFTQERVGLHGRLFTLYKFRSMYKDAEKRLDELKALNEMDGPVFKIKNDPRITPLGKIIRKTSIDELPQLFNVLAGRLSLVGPRPPLPSEVDVYEPWHRKRLSMRPGIACLWQAYHRGENDFKKWVESDIEYVNNWSLRLDIKILMRTAVTVISGKGAF